MDVFISTSLIHSSEALQRREILSVLTLPVICGVQARQSADKTLAAPANARHSTRHLAAIENLIAYSPDVRDWGINE